MSRLTVELRAMMAALVFFTRLPAPSRPLLGPDDMRRAATWWPLVGVLIGGGMSAAWWLAARVWPASVAAGLALGVGMLVTGALEQDGLADVADGFAAGPDRERILATMQQSRLGPSGVVALAIVTGLRWEAVAALPVTVVPTTLLVAQALSRAAAVGLMAMLPYLRGAGSRARPVVGRLPPLRLGVALAVGGGPLVLLPAPLRLGACVAAVAGLLSCAAWFSRKLGGYTGDCVGATQQCVELAVLLALLADVPG